MSLPEYISINGTSYASAKFSDAARAQVINVQVVDAELTRLQQQLAIAQTARNAYINALTAEIKLPAQATATTAATAAAAAAAAKPKKPRAARKSTNLD